MASINMALDEIITSQKQKGRGGAQRKVEGGRRTGGSGGAGSFPKRSGGGTRGFARGSLFSDNTPDGKWKHDRFEEINGGAKKRAAAGGAARVSRRGGGQNIVKLNISNLPESVLTADLEELFQDFDVYGVAVHYDETGAHLGTADLFVDLQSANDIIREYANIAIDGQEIKIAVVDESGTLSGAGQARIQDRIRRVAGNPIRRRKETRLSGGGARRGGPKAGGGGGARGKPVQLKKMTVEDLDKELEAYMGKKTA